MRPSEGIKIIDVTRALAGPFETPPTRVGRQTGEVPLGLGYTGAQLAARRAEDAI